MQWFNTVDFFFDRLTREPQVDRALRIQPEFRRVAKQLDSIFLAALEATSAGKLFDFPFMLDPPFDRIERDPRYIKGYLPGVRESGGQYTHAAIGRRRWPSPPRATTAAPGISPP